MSRAFGDRVEDEAARFLVGRGLKLRARNVSCRLGEIDLVLEDGETLVFCEVRYRGRDDFGDGADSVGARKRARLVACARWYLARDPRAARSPCRFDVIAAQGAAPYRFDWIRDAFRCDD